MDFKSVINSFSPEYISEITHICDNMFYNNYLEKGELESKDKIQDNIKSQVYDTFVEFWGESHASKIREKIDSSQIAFCYQTVGTKNSIESFLNVDAKRSKFRRLYGMEFNYPEAFSTVNNLLEKYNHDFIELLQKDNSYPYTIKLALKQLGTTKDGILKDSSLANLVSKQIEDLSKKYQNISIYGDNPKVNENIDKLKAFVEEFKIKVAEEVVKDCRANGVDDKHIIAEEVDKALYVNYAGVRMDPVVHASNANGDLWSLFRSLETTAFVRNNVVHFGTFPDDVTILHEYVHIVDSCGFEKGHNMKSQGHYSNQYRENEMFNEVVTEYFAKKMFEKRVALGKDCIVNCGDIGSEYRKLFPIMDGFLARYLPELKETRLREYPAEEFTRLIGQQEFSNISSLCNELYALSHDSNLREILESLPEAEQLRGTLEDANGKLSGFRSLLEKVVRESENLTTKWKDSNKPYLQKLAKLAYGATGVFENLTQNYVKKTLAEPIQSGSFEPELDSENERVMEKTIK